MNKIFIFVRDLLIKISDKTGLSYNAINIIIYYYIIPYIYFLIIDYKFQIHIFKISFLVIILLSFILIKNFNDFADSLFLKSQFFLRWFKCIGWNYVVASVIICVFIPIIMLFLILIA